jgi:hypothetical protein
VHCPARAQAVSPGRRWPSPAAEGAGPGADVVVAKPRIDACVALPGFGVACLGDVCKQGQADRAVASPSSPVPLAQSHLPSPACQSRLPSPACPIPLAQSLLPNPSCPIPLAQSHLPNPTCPFPLAHSHLPDPRLLVQVWHIGRAFASVADHRARDRKPRQTPLASLRCPRITSRCAHASVRDLRRVCIDNAQRHNKTSGRAILQLVVPSARSRAVARMASPAGNCVVLGESVLECEAGEVGASLRPPACLTAAAGPEPPTLVRVALLVAPRFSLGRPCLSSASIRRNPRAPCRLGYCAAGVPHRASPSACCSARRL